MEKQRSFFLSIPGVALITVIILLVPLVGMQFSNEVNWSVSDFVVMGFLLFSTGVLFVLVIRMAANIVYRAGMGLAVGATFLMIWSNLAVGLIGSGPHAGNLMYAGVIAVLLIGIYLSRFNAVGMERAMFVTALALMLLSAIALAFNMQDYPGSSVVEIIGVNLFFAFLYIISGLLFRYVALGKTTTD